MMNATHSYGYRTTVFIALFTLLLGIVGAQPASALPEGFIDTPVGAALPGLPVAMRFAEDGTVFFAMKEGRIYVKDSITATTPTQFVDIRSEVMDASDQGLLGVAAHPNWDTTPYVYAVYTVVNGDTHSGRITRWTYDKNTRLPVPNSRVDILSNAWCFTGSTDAPYASHSIGDIMFGPDGALYAGAGDGANYDAADEGQFPIDTCDEPAREGGALRSQDIETSTDPASLAGSIIRINPIDGSPLADNPFISSPDANKQRIIAYGLRNPFRFTIDQSTGELWVPDNGWSDWEEVNYIADPNDAVVENFGWPCYEGVARQPGYQGLANPICEALYAKNTAVAPFVQLRHAAPDFAFSSTGAVVYSGNSFPAQYNRALFFADYAAAESPEFGGQVDADPDNSLRVIFRDQNGELDASTMVPFVQDARVRPVDLQVGPNGALYYIDLPTQQVRMIQFGGPTARITASETAGPTPFTVDFDGSTSTDPDGLALTYGWDLDNDGQFDDGSAAQVSRTFTVVGTYTIRLRVTDVDGNTASTSIQITAGAGSANAAPVITITAPAPGFTYAIGDPITFSARVVDPDGITLPSSQLEWQPVINHCQPNDASNCHTHPLDRIFGLSGTIAGPEHENPSSLSFRLQATEQPWWNAAWDYRMLVRLNTQQVSQTLVNFPVLVTLTPSNFNYGNAQPDGDDLRFIDGNNQELSYEIDSWNPGGTSTVWVRFPAVTAAADAGAWLYYGNDAAARAETPSAVWSQNYIGVYHLSSATTVTNAVTGATTGTVTGQPNLVTGINGPALSFNGNSYLTTDVTQGLAAGDWSVTLWAKLDESIPCIDGPEAEVEGTDLLVKEYDHRVYLKQSCKLGFITRRAAGDPTSTALGTGDTQIFEVGTPEDRAWHSVTYQYKQDGSIVEAYFNGVLAGTNVTQTSVFSTGTPFTIGGGGPFPTKNYTGLIDQVTIATAARSADWIEAEYAVMTGSFVTLGQQQTFQTTQVQTTSAVAIAASRTANVSFTSVPAGAVVTVYGRDEATPRSEAVTHKGQVQFSAPQNQIVDGISYVFSSWTIGGVTNTSRVQVLRIGTEDLSIVANYVPAATRLLITTNPGDVRVFIGTTNTTLVGTTNANGSLNLTLTLPSSPASYVLRLEKSRYQTEFVPIQIVAGEQKQVLVQMRPNGTVNVTTDPVDATVYVDGVEQQGTTPMVLSLLPGNYSIEISKSGFVTRSEFVTVTENSSQSLTVELTAQPRRSGGGGGGGGGGSRRTTATVPFVSRLNATNTTNSTTGTPVGTGSIATTPGSGSTAAQCTSAWTCTEWSVCAAGTQTRTCTDTANCAVPRDKPSETQSCTVIEPASPLTGEVVGDTEGVSESRGPVWLLIASLVFIFGAIGLFIAGRSR